MQLTLDDAKTKELLTEVLVELLQQKRSLFYELILDALEEVGLANAIIEGENTEFVEEAEIRTLLERPGWRLHAERGDEGRQRGEPVAHGMG